MMAPNPIRTGRAREEKRTAVSGEDETKPKGRDAYAQEIGGMSCCLPLLTEFRLEYRLGGRLLIEFFVVPDSVVADGARAD